MTCNFEIGNNCFDDGIVYSILILLAVFAIFLGIFISHVIFKKLCSRNRPIEKDIEKSLTKTYVDKRTIINPKYYNNRDDEFSPSILDTIKFPSDDDDEVEIIN